MGFGQKALKTGTFLWTLFALGAGMVQAQFGVPISPPAALNTNAATDIGNDDAPQITTDGQGHWVTVWNSDDTLGGTIGSDADILVARSSDNGATWTAPAALNTNAATDSGDDWFPQVTTDGQGHWVTVWNSNDTLGGMIGSDVDILVARSGDNGATWTVPAALNTNAATDSGDDLSPQVTTDGQGHWVAVWYSNDTLGGTIGSDWEILVARSSDHGATWTAPAALKSSAATDGSNDYHPQVATDGQGHWVAAWYSDDSLGGTIGSDADILVARSSDHGATWTAPAALNTNAATDSGVDCLPQVTADGQGHWVAVWYSTDTLGGTIGSDWDILVARSSDHGATWTAPAALNTNAATDSGDDYVPQVATDGQGRWVAAWYSRDTLGGTIGSDWDILVARSGDNGTTWTAPAALNTNAATDSGGDYRPQVRTDGQGHWVAVWQSLDTLGGTIGSDYDVLVARFALPDCNSNGIPDSEDIAGGASTDCNSNGVPDECDIAGGASTDCNGNGVPDECEPDSDNDGTINACDGCPDDPAKIALGACGCGVADIDTDSDGVPDCNDGCSNDALKIAPGVCGCGVADVDTDIDGVPDCIDNCANTPNVDQADSNADGIGDACEAPPAAQSGCGGCGVGIGMMLPLTLLSLAWMKRRQREA